MGRILVCLTVIFSGMAAMAVETPKTAYDFSFKSIGGEPLPLSNFRGKVVLLVNTASQCGFTGQYNNLQSVWSRFRERGLVVLGVPSNDFGNQEPGSNVEIKDFCEAKFGITFPMTEKVSVKGENAHPFYLWAKKNHGKSAIPKWNFHKIMIGRNGKVVDTFASITNPSSKKFIIALEEALN